VEKSSDRAWITSLLQHRLGCENVAYNDSVRTLSGRQLTLGTSAGNEQPSDMIGWSAEELGWVIALEAQSCAYLALELQALAQRLSETQITCPESTYRRLYDSHAMFRRLVEFMQQSFRDSNANGNDGSLPVLSARMVQEIRSMLAQETATTSEGYTISSERAET
jgi:hypothetical protein